MINLNNLERRIAALEIAPEGTQIDPFSEALKALDVSELGLLDEYVSLQSAGFSEEAIHDMVGEESYQQNLAICDKVDQEIRLKTTVPRHQHEPEPKQAEKFGSSRKNRGRPRKDEAACQA
jgi:hypothetical protein